jgi:hypothetical protein
MSTGTVARWRFVKASDLRNDTVGFDELEVRSATADERLGSVRGFIVDGDSGQLHYVVVDSGGWFTGGSYLVPPAYTRVDAEQKVLWAETTRQAIGRFPEFDSMQYPTLSDEQLWGIERRIIEAYGDDPGVIAPSAAWDRSTWAQYRQPEWWRRDYYATAVAADPSGGVTTSRAIDTAPAIAQSRPVRPASATGDLRPAGWPDPDVDRAQPGDVLGIERGGETTSLGETDEDEDRRRRTAEKEYREAATKEERDRAADRGPSRR